MDFIFQNAPPKLIKNQGLSLRYDVMEALCMKCRHRDKCVLLCETFETQIRTVQKISEELDNKEE